ncbi:hypothetical protein [Geodermatophilus sabuli]|uniref:hypothetical protein n=1 Tax=Geodermatophilus sabuli TaxID=1564158 RepID=UPI00117AE93A|nr:hypothetical protein [Geodermatophilus sabuli]MBB3082942.1 hypothetical protein [Geodermatophilus sabuli]
MADNVRHVRVTEDEVAAAKLEIQLLERLGRPVDERLRVIADAKPAERQSTIATSEDASLRASKLLATLRDAMREAREGREKGNVLPSVRRHHRERYPTGGYAGPDVIVSSWWSGIPILIDANEGVGAAPAVGSKLLPTQESANIRAEHVRIFHALALARIQDAERGIEELRTSERDGLSL